MTKWITAKMILKLRNFFWDIRRRINKDAFETKRSEDYCGVISLKERGQTFKEFIEIIESFPVNGNLPEKDCLLQYEESGQLCSLHWMIDDETQLHVRLFKDNRGDYNRAQEYIIVHAHMEIRPDYNPLKHILGFGFTPACVAFRHIDEQATENFKYKDSY